MKLEFKILFVASFLKLDHIEDVCPGLLSFYRFLQFHNL